MANLLLTSSVQPSLHLNLVLSIMLSPVASSSKASLVEQYYDAKSTFLQYVSEGFVDILCLTSAGSSTTFISARHNPPSRS